MPEQERKIVKCNAKYMMFSDVSIILYMHNLSRKRCVKAVCIFISATCNRSPVQINDLWFLKFKESSKSLFAPKFVST